MTIEGSEANEVTENNMTEIFNVNRAVRQDDALLVISFNLVLDCITKKLVKRKNISI